LTQSLEQLTQKHDRLIALDRYINNFESTNTATKATKTKKIKAKAKKELEVGQNPHLPQDEEISNREEVFEAV